MNELLKRSVTGVVYIFLLLVAIMLNAQAFSFLFLVFGLICIYEFKRLLRLSNYRVFIAFLVMWWLFIYVPTNAFLRYLFLFSVIITNVYLVFYLYKKGKNSFSEKEKFIISLLYIGGGCIFIPMIYQNEVNYSSVGDLFPLVISLNEAQHTMIAILCIIWASDSFAYLSGMLFGKRKLFPSVSPKKTIEGFVGGFVGAILTALTFSIYSAKSQFVWIVLAIVLVVMGTIGDLVESKFKREAGKKDSGTILPGHGGLLDRLDSLVFASPFAFLVLEILSKLDVLELFQ